MRRDLIVMGTIAAVVGLALALLLTASFGARSSGPPAALKRADGTPSAAVAEVAAKHEAATLARRRAERRKLRRQHRRARARRAASRPAVPVVAQSRPATTTQSESGFSPQESRQTQTVTSPSPSPSPKPQPVQRQSHPKPAGSGGGGPGGSFDDSG